MVTLFHIHIYIYTKARERLCAAQCVEIIYQSECWVDSMMSDNTKTHDLWVIYLH